MLGLLLCLGMAITVFNSCGDEDFWTIKTATISNDINGVVINGVRWATRNVDVPSTFAAKPEDAGMFYQWNRKIGWSATNPMINSNGDTTWDSSTPTGDRWEKANDPSPAGWRLPTLNEIQTLLDANRVDNRWTIKNGIKGRIFTDKATGNSLFLPAAGYRDGNGGTFYNVGSYGYYWSSTQYGADDADYLGFGSGTEYWWNSSYRGNGFSVRPVAD